MDAIAAAITFSCIGIIFVLYLLGMFFQYRSLLYHVWNHLAILIFAIYGIELLFIILFLAMPNGIPCQAWVTMIDGARSASAISLLAMFFIFMFPPCFEPEKKKLFGFEVMIFGSISVWTLAQVALYSLTGKFQNEGTHRCHMQISQSVLAGVFVWAPIFINFIASGVFIWWLKSRDVMLRRNRVNRFAWIVFISCAMKAISAVGEIKNAVDMSHMNATQIAHRVHQHETEQPDGLFFFVFFFYDIHLFLLAFAFIYGEDLIPRWVRAPTCFTKTFCCCCVADETDWAEQENQQQQQFLEAAAVQQHYYQKKNSSRLDDGNNNNNNNNVVVPDDEEDKLIVPSSQGSLNDHNNYGAATVPSSQQQQQDQSNNNKSSSSPRVSNANSRSQMYFNDKNDENQRASLMSNSTHATNYSTLSQQIIRARDPRSIRHTLTYFLMMIRNDIVTSIVENNVPSSVIRSSDYSQSHNRIGTYASSAAGSGGGLTSVPNYHAIPYDDGDTGANDDDDQISRSSLFHRNNNYSESSSKF